MKMKQFNINNYVYVKLTQEGIDELKRQHDELYTHIGKDKEFIPPNVDENGYSKFQMWSLMERFGHTCGLGSKLMFDSRILFEDKYLKRFGEE